MVVLEWSTNFLGACIFLLYIRGALFPRFRGKKDLGGCLGVLMTYFILVTMMNYVFRFDGYVGILVYAMAGCLAAFVLTVAKWVDYLAMGITWSSIALSSSVIAASALMLFEEGSLRDILLFGNPQKTIALFLNLVAKLLMVTIIISIRKLGKQSSMDKLVCCILFMLVSGIGMSVFRHENMLDTKLNTDNYMIIMTMVLIFLLFVVMYYSMRIGSLIRQKEESRLVGITSEKQSAELLLTAEKITELRQFQHDSDKAMHTLKELMKDRNYGEAESFLNQYENYSKDIKASYLYTGIPIIDAVVGTRQMEMKNSDIEFICTIQSEIPEPMIMSFGIILANLLDNAIEAERGEKERREIRLKVMKKGAYLCCIVENRIDKSVLVHNMNLRTTKKDFINHGLGVKSIEYHCKMHKGFHGVREENGYFIHEVRLIL